MAYDELLAKRIRNQVGHLSDVEEKKMIGGLTFMVNDKMCVGVSDQSLMARIGPEEYEKALKQPGCRKMDFTGREMKGFVFVDEEGIRSENDLGHWIGLAMAFNEKAKSSVRKRKKKH